MNFLRYAALAAVLAAGATQPASAAAVYVNNHSFEAQVLADGDYRNGSAPTGWTSGYVEPSGPLNPPASEFNAPVPHGQNVMFSATGYDGRPYYSGNVYQQVLESVAANTRYTLMVDIGHSNNVDLADFAVELSSGLGLEFAPYAWGSFASSEVGVGQFRTLTVVFDAIDAINAPLGIRLRTMHNPDQGQTQRIAFFDNVRLDASPLVAGAVPEPATWAMMILGFGMTGGLLRRRRTPQHAMA